MKTRKLLSLLMVLCMMVSMIAMTAGTASAAENDPGLRDVSAFFETPGNVNYAIKVYFGNKTDDTKYVWQTAQVNDGTTSKGSLINSNSEKIPAGTVMLVARNLHGETAYAAEGGTASYKDSLLKAALDKIVTDNFTAAEAAAVAPRDLAAQTGKWRPGVAGEAVTGALLWPLTVQLMDDLGGLKSASKNYWLRTSENGKVFLNTKSAVDVTETASVLPGMYLDLNKILIVEMINTETTGAGYKKGTQGSLNALPKSESKTAKLTLLDETRQFAVTKSVTNGLYARVEYSGAVTGENEYVSVILKDKNTGLFTHYGRIAKAEASGAVVFDVEDIDLTTKTMYVFNEQYNGGKTAKSYISDYASAFVEVTLTEDLNADYDEDAGDSTTGGTTTGGTTTGGTTTGGSTTGGSTTGGTTTGGTTNNPQTGDTQVALWTSLAIVAAFAMAGAAYFGKKYATK